MSLSLLLIVVFTMTAGSYGFAQSFRERREQAHAERVRSARTFSESQVPALKELIYKKLLKMASRNGGLVSSTEIVLEVDGAHV